jgi:hypothetical protein
MYVQSKCCCIPLALQSSSHISSSSILYPFGSHHTLQPPAGPNSPSYQLHPIPHCTLMHPICSVRALAHGICDHTLQHYGSTSPSHSPNHIPLYSTALSCILAATQPERLPCTLMHPSCYSAQNLVLIMVPDTANSDSHHSAHEPCNYSCNYSRVP